ncbi:MAG: type IV pilus biogenesis/stability protein PilW [Dokdonella sp.]
MQRSSVQRVALLRLCGFLALLFLAACSTTSSRGIKRESAADRREEAARANTELGQRYMQQGKLELALEKLNRALAADSDYVDAHTVVAVLYEQIGDEKQAEEHYRRASQLRQKGGAEANNYGTFLCKLRRYDEATGYFDRALADPFYRTPEVALTNAGTCLVDSGKYVDAERDLKLALSKNQNNVEALFQMARLLYATNDFFRARAFMQRFEAAAKPRPDALLLARNIELQLRNGEAAREYTRRLLQGFPESPQARELDSKGAP